jgi:hypothetical protein
MAAGDLTPAESSKRRFNALLSRALDVRSLMLGDPGSRAVAIRVKLRARAIAEHDLDPHTLTWQDAAGDEHLEVFQLILDTMWRFYDAGVLDLAIADAEQQPGRWRLDVHATFPRHGMPPTWEDEAERIVMAGCQAIIDHARSTEEAIGLS